MRIIDAVTGLVWDCLRSFKPKSGGERWVYISKIINLRDTEK